MHDVLHKILASAEEQEVAVLYKQRFDQLQFMFQVITEGMIFMVKQKQKTAHLLQQV